ncbi:MAG TPA: hypothetical protein VKH63_15510 [Candidatus Acidoferrum sp.]|nr:hypothetical protein [Candidatus Acidoferrum sp.]
MIELDELKAKWENQDQQLEKSLRLNRQLLSEAKLKPAEAALRREAIYTGLEAALWLVVVIALGSFVADHIRVPELALSAAAADFMSIGIFIALVQRIVRTSQVDYTQPISTNQKKVEALRMLRIRTTKWGVLCGALLWIPWLAVVSQVVFGVDIYKSVDTAWLIVNALFGLSLFPLAIWVSKKYGDRAGRSPFIQRLMKDLEGNNLAAAQDFLASLGEFDTQSDE